MAHYCYKANFSEDYERSMKEGWKKMHGKECENVQEQFVYNLEGGAHSVHVQKRFEKEMSKIVEEYLTYL